MVNIDDGDIEGIRHKNVSVDHMDRLQQREQLTIAPLSTESDALLVEEITDSGCDLRMGRFQKNRS